jgi:hypothetical protein
VGKDRSQSRLEQSAKGDGDEALMSIKTEGVVWNITLPLGEPPPDEAVGNRIRRRRGTRSGIPQRSLLGFKVLAGMETGMNRTTVFFGPSRAGGSSG